MSASFNGIHMGQRLEYYVRGAKHGDGSGGFSKFSKRGSSSIIGLFKKKSLDFYIVEKACEYYDLTLAEFLNIPESEIPEWFQTSGKKNADFEVINEKLDKILEEVSK